ncbi:5837_t:CDS:2, partial [Dentiscutata heterogama]
MTIYHLPVDFDVEVTNGKYSANKDKILHDHNKLTQFCLAGFKELVKKYSKENFYKNYIGFAVNIVAKIHLDEDITEEVEKVVYTLLVLQENKQTQDISPKEVNNVPNLFVDHPSNASPSPCEEDRKIDEFLDSFQKQDLTSDNKRSLQKKKQREKFIQKVSSNLIQSDTDLAKQQLVTLSLTSSPCKQADFSSFVYLYEKLHNTKDFADQLSTYTLLKDGLPSNEKNSELSLPDLSSESDKKNSESAYINISNALEEQTSSKSG